MRSTALRSHSSRGLMLVFLAVLLPPAAALVWLGLQLLEQDRTFLAQREATRREAAADAIGRALTQSVAEAERWLTDGDVPEGAVRVTISQALPRVVSVYPTGRTYWVPEASALQEAAADIFADAERAEYRGVGDRGRSTYAAGARSADASVRAGALLRLGRLHRREGRTDEALTAYARLAEHEAIGINGTPAELAARRAICDVLESAGRLVELRAQCAALETHLTSGRWLLDRAAWELAARDVERWTGRPPGSRERLALSAAVDWLVAREALHDLQGTDHRLVAADGVPMTILWRSGADGVRALALAPSLLDRWIAAARERREGAVLRVALVGDSAEHIAGDRVNEGPRITRSSVETRLPWTLVFAPVESDTVDAELANRRRLLAGGLVALVVLLIGGTYLLWRVIQRELAVVRLQSDFVAAVSHEFRTPLTSLRHIIELLQESDDIPAARRRSFYSTLGHSAERLHRLVESLLDFSRMEHGKRRWSMRQIHVAELTAGVVADFRREHPAAAVMLDVTSAENEIVDADSDALAHALWNLLDNAAKYSPAGGEIRVSVRPAGGGIEISVADQGLGIPSREHRDVFRKFVRGATAVKLGIKGTGLGLAMVAQTVQAHHGRIGIESAEGHGSTFTIWVPAIATERASEIASLAHAANPDR